MTIYKYNKNTLTLSVRVFLFENYERGEASHLYHVPFMYTTL